eukprot:snap_masked-scaffold_36-processed-gene-2.56-mRNA-1 protein AED:1.00 eAED:1.00 QI:0/0/0/0/1/1/2/0/146
MRVKGFWTQEEDKLLRDAVNEIQRDTCGRIYKNISWVKVSRIVSSRDASQCRQRWVSFLSPNVKKTPWTGKEDDAILKLFMELGPKWSQFSQHEQLLGRTDFSIRTRFRALLKEIFPLDKSQTKEKKSYTSKEKLVADTLLLLQGS